MSFMHVAVSVVICSVNEEVIETACVHGLVQSRVALWNPAFRDCAFWSLPLIFVNPDVLTFVTVNA